MSRAPFKHNKTPFLHAPRAAKAIASYKTPSWQSCTHRLVLHCAQERLAKELVPYLKEFGGYAKATDKTLDLLFDEACQESLRINCLDRADGFTRKAHYQQVILVARTSGL